MFKDDLKHGKGIYKWPNGKSIEGEWVNGKQEGKGVFTGINGEKKVGLWENGKRMAWE